MKILRFILFPFAIIYGGITALRNGFYRFGIFKSSKFNLPIINIGNLSTGGTGKTPHTEYLIRLLKEKHQLFTLSRGFGRKERGFIIADENSTATQIGDEPLQYSKKFGTEIGVAVEANRVMGVMEICRSHPETDLILLDDAFQHRAIHAGLSILITDYSNPFYKDFMLPVGNLRELRRGKNRADLIVVSKCPNFDEIEKEKIIARIHPNKNQTVFFSKIKYGGIFALSGAAEMDQIIDQKIILVTGIAKANPLLNHLKESNSILHHFNFNDHYNFKQADITEIHNLFDKFAGENPVIVTTEKDAMRLLTKAFASSTQKYPWFYQSIEIEMDNASRFNEIVKQYVEKNS
ncbi:MAG: tetraacyldisaccharide 4'-kinase [Crocinitomix sp.]|nr:tetraacyldisaccharide 4'-kinase [Crocinitomix sp.]